MSKRQTYIIKNFPEYGEAIVNPQIVASMGIGRYALRLDSHRVDPHMWFEVSHGEITRMSTFATDKECLAWKRLKEYLRSQGVYGGIYGWRGSLCGQAATILLNHCDGFDQDDFSAARRAGMKDIILDFHDFYVEQTDNKKETT